MGLNCSKSLSIDPMAIGSKLVHKSPNGSKWHQIIPNWSKWLQMGPNRLEKVQMDPNWPKLFQKGLKWSKWDNLDYVGTNGFKSVHTGANWSKWANIGWNMFKLIQIGLDRSKQKSNSIPYGLIWSKIDKILTKKSSKWVWHNQVSWSSFVFNETL